MNVKLAEGNVDVKVEPDQIGKLVERIINAMKGRGKSITKIQIEITTE